MRTTQQQAPVPFQVSCLSEVGDKGLVLGKHWVFSMGGDLLPLQAPGQAHWGQHSPGHMFVEGMSTSCVLRVKSPCK